SRRSNRSVSRFSTAKTASMVARFCSLMSSKRRFILPVAVAEGGFSVREARFRFWAATTRTLLSHFGQDASRKLAQLLLSLAQQTTFSVMDFANDGRRHTRENSGIRLDRNGRWWHDGVPIEHPKIIDAFNRGLSPTDGGRFRLDFGNDWCFVQV